jgi:hypothetical protein
VLRRPSTGQRRICSARLLAEAAGRGTDRWGARRDRREWVALLEQHRQAGRDRLPGDRVVTFNRYDRVLVPSQFNATVFERSGVEPPVLVVPHIARPLGRSSQQPKRSDTFVFYLIAAWTSRKAILDSAPHTETKPTVRYCQADWSV